jgi:peroxiredoxin/outer membrane lipoprotein-sorting protein
MKTAKVIPIALISILITICPSRASRQDEARALLDKVADRYSSLKQYQFEGTVTVTVMAKGAATEVEMQTVMMSDGPSKSRTEMMSPVFGMVTVTNGDTTWVYLSALNQYMKKPTAELEKKGRDVVNDNFSAVGGFGDMLQAQANALQDINKRVKQARILREETIYPQGTGIDCVVIEVEQEPADGPAKDKPASIVRTLWVEKARLLIVRHQILVKMKGGEEGGDTEMKTVSLLRTARINEPIPESSFTFAPPSGAKLVDDFAAPSTAKRNVADTATGEPASRFVGKEADDFKLKDLNGKKVELKSLRGNVVVLDFWATWCAPCREEMPHLEKLHREFKDKGLMIVGINTEDAKAARSFMKKYDYTFMTLIDDGNASVIYRVEAIPTVFVLDKEGKITSHYIGAQSEEVLREAIRKAGIE